MSIYDIKKEDLQEKYKYLLKYFCYVNSDKLCNELSYNKSGCCINCKHIIRNEMFDLLEQYNTNERIIFNNIKNLLDIHYNMPNKEYKTKNVINIFEIIYYNMFFIIIHPKFLITITHKITEIIGLEKIFVMNFINKINYKKHIFKYMCDMYDFINNYKKNNIIDQNMSKENIKLYLDSYIKFIENHYNINYYKNTIYNDNIDNIDNIDIDINNIDNIDIIIEL